MGLSGVCVCVDMGVGGGGVVEINRLIVGNV